MPTKTPSARPEAQAAAARKRAPRSAQAAAVSEAATALAAATADAAQAPVPRKSGARKTTAAKAAPPASTAKTAKDTKTATTTKAGKPSPTAKAAKPEAAAKTAKTAKTAKADRTAKAEPKAVPKVAPKVAPARAARAQTPAPQAAVVADAVVIDGPADGALFGAYDVRIPDEEAATVLLRAAPPSGALCTCLDFQLSEQGDCPHLQVLLPQLQADAERAAALQQGPQQPGSRVVLRHGARRQPLWLPGVDCPEALDALAQKALGGEAAAFDEQALARVLRAAREAGHDVQVDDEVWQQLALTRDMHARVQRLEALFAQGPASAELQALGAPEGRPLLPLQVEGALFAVCAGRAILADAPALQPQRQALAAALLLQRHFGVELVRVIAPAARLPSWQRALPAQSPGFAFTPLEEVALQGARLLEAPADLVIVQEDDSGLWIDPERAAALLRLPAGFAIVLPAADWLQRAAELPLRVAFVDAARQGPYAALLQAHGERDEDGALCGLHDLQNLRQTLAPVLLARTLDEVRGQLPERVDSVLHVPMPQALQAEHARMCATLAATVARWQQAGWLPDVEQRRLVAQVQALRRLCAGAEAPASAAVSAAKAAALAARLDDGAAPVAKAVVFAQWPQALQALQAGLAQAGIAAALWSSAEAASAREAALQRFHDEAGCRVLLVADPGSGALELRVPQAQVLHLDRPWNPRVLSRRFGRVHRRGKAQLVPVTQLLLQGSFEDAVHQVIADRREPPVTDLLDALADEGFAQGAACAQWLGDLHEVLQRCAGEPQASAASAGPTGATGPAAAPHS
jgi:hypothetical protein